MRGCLGLCHRSLYWTWNYGHEVEELKSLYEKGKVNQWNAETDLDWSIPVSKDEWLANPESSLLAQLAKLMGASAPSVRVIARRKPECDVASKAYASAKRRCDRKNGVFRRSMM